MRQPPNTTGSSKSKISKTVVMWSAVTWLFNSAVTEVNKCPTYSVATMKGWFKSLTEMRNRNSNSHRKKVKHQLKLWRQEQKWMRLWLEQIKVLQRRLRTSIWIITTWRRSCCLYRSELVPRSCWAAYQKSCKGSIRTPMWVWNDDIVALLSR